MSNRLLAAARQNPRTALSSVARWYRRRHARLFHLKSGDSLSPAPLGDIARVCSRRGYCR